MIASATTAIAFAAIPSAIGTPSPTTPPDELVTPGFAGFAVIVILVIAVIVLIADMLRRVRRTRYRAEIDERLDAEQNQGAGTSEESAADDAEPDGPDGGAAGPSGR
ncbi:hypothetical protein M4I32_03235 [Microbacterium sp. LRZ72]|uniref:hypothetical protein n=1 Tax=Microbacterium sp. LRZ72 TaxID=2942481 RepID=UPI0029BD8646|nr:hypothetical protein [Microbacterium sp. LRZ72]MDX2375810.1 hypothetical protein [Microbacterium sp. LRZ72]